MNIILNPRQSGTKLGGISLVGSVDLTNKENFLAKIVNASGVAKFALPTALDDLATHVIGSGDIAGGISTAEQPNLNENFRAVLKGTCVAGDVLSLADPGTAADAGKLRKQPTTTGTWRSFAVAEETGADGQYILCHRVAERTTVI